MMAAESRRSQVLKRRGFPCPSKIDRAHVLHVEREAGLSFLPDQTRGPVADNRPVNLLFHWRAECHR